MEGKTQNQLISKVQYKNFEPGEFTDRSLRTYDELIRLIDSFPWQQQRDHLKVSLTNPSITLEDPEGNYLKLALYYNDKFVLYYFNRSHQLFTKSFTNYTGAYMYLKKFYGDPSFDTTDFHLEHTLLQYNEVHFIDQDFRYTVTRKSILSYLLITSGINFMLALFFIALMLFHHNTALPVWLFVIPFMFLLGGGPNMILFYNYYGYSKGKILIISKGNDIFWFGLVDNPEKFDKKEIMQVTVYRDHNHRSITSGFARIEIEFKSVRYLNIPNLLIDYKDLTSKLFEYPLVDAQKGWPAIPSDAAAPS